MSNQNVKLPNSYIPNVIKTPATSALNTLKNTANNMFGFGGNGGNNKGVIGNIVNTTTNRLSNAGTAITNATSNVANKVGNIGTNVASTVLPSNVVNTMEGSSIPWGIIIVLILLGVVVGLIVYFYEDLKQLINRLRGDSEPVLPPMPPMPAPTEEKPAPPMPMQTATPPQNIDAIPPATAVEKLLPTKKEVFNISSNRFMYEDAAPLCKALGAELATYDQVKDAYDKGADWCNYGWTKGQLALFPTQKETWDKLQAGPEGQRMACGKVGLNGGHFDNPEMRFGVNCYGVKPSQSAHDASTKAKGYPLSPDALEFDRKVAKYRSQADHLDVLPFKEGSWNT
jgi:hypothetical protein